MISVVVTFHNNQEYVKQCVESIMNQTYKDIEIILIDDGSEDNTAGLCREYSDKYEKVIYNYVDHGGVSKARNTGIEIANGDFIMFVDGDDYLCDTIVEKLYNNLDDETDIICCSCIAFNEAVDLYDECHFFDKDYEFKTNIEKEHLYNQLLDDSYGRKDEKMYTAIGVPWGKLYRKSFLIKNELKFFPKLIRMQDNVFNMYAFEKARKIKYCNASLYMYRVNHILSYKAAYKPEIYMNIAEERINFFNNVYQEASEELLLTFKKFNVLLCLISLKNIALTNKFKEAKKKMKELCNNKIYKNDLMNFSLDFFSKKDKYGLLLIRKKCFGLLAILLKLKAKVS